MKLKTLHNDLKGLYKGKETGDLFGFTFEHEEDEIKSIINLYKKGFWSVVPFAFDGTSIIGVRMLPNFKVNQMPVVEYYPELGSSITFSPNLESIVTFGNVRNLKTKKYCGYILEDLEDTDKLSAPLFEYFESENNLEVLSKYLSEINTDDFFKDDVKAKEEIFKTLWSYYNNSTIEKSKNELFNSLINDSFYIPNSIDADFGVWNTFVNNTLAQRAASYNIETSNYWEYIWKGALEAQGFDTASVNITKTRPYPNLAKYEMKYVASYFDFKNKVFYDQIPEKYKNHPIFEATQEIYLNNKTYVGDKHLVAAAILDEEHNDPLGAWNALITASYWAGVNSPGAIPIYWKAAITLAERYNWTEIHEVLVQQLEFYMKYKDQY